MSNAFWFSFVTRRDEGSARTTNYTESKAQKVINMSDNDLPLSISVASVSDFLHCPVCMSPMEHTCMTPCGHRYCFNCIRECVDRHRKCPCCNKKIKIDQLIRDPLYDDLIATILREKEASEKVYFDTLIDRATKASHAELDSCVRDPALAPLEAVLTKHLKESMLSHQQYFQDLKREFERNAEHLKSSHSEALKALQRQPLPEAEVLEHTQKLELDLEEDQLGLQAELDKSATMVADAFDRYLTEHIPNLSILPVCVTVNLLGKDIRLENIVLKPHQSMEDLIKIIDTKMEERGDKVIDMSDVKFIHFGAFSKRSAGEMHHMVSDIILHGATHPDIYMLPMGCKPVLQFNLKAGCEIAVYGNIQCESDLPKRCFVDTFVESGTAAAGNTMDYFRCRDCRFNWICRPCTEVCHQNHTVEPYIMSHQPSWACCYCPKKKKCIIKE